MFLNEIKKYQKPLFDLWSLANILIAILKEVDVLNRIKSKKNIFLDIGYWVSANSINGYFCQLMPIWIIATRKGVFTWKIQKTKKDLFYCQLQNHFDNWVFGYCKTWSLLKFKNPNWFGNWSVLGVSKTTYSARAFSNALLFNPMFLPGKKIQKPKMILEYCNNALGKNWIRGNFVNNAIWFFWLSCRMKSSKRMLEMDLWGPKIFGNGMYWKRGHVFTMKVQKNWFWKFFDWAFGKKYWNRINFAILNFQLVFLRKRKGVWGNEKS